MPPDTQDKSEAKVPTRSMQCSTSSMTFPQLPNLGQPQVTITLQPESTLQRFRYQSELGKCRSAGSIIAGFSSDGNKTFPTIMLSGYQGPFAVLACLVSKDPPYRPHPHSLISNEKHHNNSNGIVNFIAETTPGSLTTLISFSKLGIKCIKSKSHEDIVNTLKYRRDVQKIDPFHAGYAHINNTEEIDFTAVRICFQILLPGPGFNISTDMQNLSKFNRTLKSLIVASDIVYDKKKISKLIILSLDRCSSPVTGGKVFTLLCEKYTGADPEVVFEDLDNSWEAVAHVHKYHKQSAIVIETPRYSGPKCESIKVQVYLRRISKMGRETSCPVPFEYYTIFKSEHGVKRMQPNYLDHYMEQPCLKQSKHSTNHTFHKHSDPPTSSINNASLYSEPGTSQTSQSVTIDDLLGLEDRILNVLENNSNWRENNPSISTKHEEETYDLINDLNVTRMPTSVDGSIRIGETPDGLQHNLPWETPSTSTILNQETYNNYNIYHQNAGVARMISNYNDLHSISNVPAQFECSRASTASDNTVAKKNLNNRPAMSSNVCSLLPYINHTGKDPVLNCDMTVMTSASPMGHVMLENHENECFSNIPDLRNESNIDVDILLDIDSLAENFNYSTSF